MLVYHFAPGTARIDSWYLMSWELQKSRWFLKHGGESQRRRTWIRPFDLAEKTVVGFQGAIWAHWTQKSKYKVQIIK